MIERWLRPLRLVFVVFHVVAITLVALPSAGGAMNRSAWQSETVQGEFRTWTARLQSLGVKITVPQLEDRLWTFAQRYEHGKHKVLEPLRPYYKYAGTGQSWRMFVAPHRFPGRLIIEIQQDDEWTPIYVARSDEHTWRRRPLDHDRMRSSVFRYAWKHFRHGRKRFTEWVAREVAHDFPEATRVRVSFLRYRTPTPAEARAGEPPETRRELENTRLLERYREGAP